MIAFLDAYVASGYRRTQVGFIRREVRICPGRDGRSRVLGIGYTRQPVIGIGPAEKTLRMFGLSIDFFGLIDGHGVIHWRVHDQ